MSNREPIEIFEIDLDYCNLSFGKMEPNESPDLTKSNGDSISSTEIDRSASVFFIADVSFDDAAPVGCIWEQGDTSEGVYLGVTSGELVFRVGNGAALPQDDCASIRTDVTPLLGLSGSLIAEIKFDGNSIRLRFVGDNKVKYVDITATTVTEFPSVWAGSGSGAIGRVDGAYSTGESASNWNGTIVSAKFWSGEFSDVGCPAALGGSCTYECFNTFFTCPVRSVYDKGVKTYRHSTPRTSLKGDYFPDLTSVSGRSAKANIAGADSKMKGLGERGTVTANFIDFTHHDRGIDKSASRRVTGEAQLSGVGYDPLNRGTFWAKLKARNPNYAGRTCRHITGTIDNGVLTVDATRSFIIESIDGPDTNYNVSIEGRDILALADNDRAVIPRPSSGVLAYDVAKDATVLYLTPEGIGSDYPSEGYAAIGSELVYYTISGDTVTLVSRGESNTTVASHSSGDTFQISYSPRLRRIDYVIYDILTTAGVPAEFIEFDDWVTECDRWAPSLNLTADIMKPEGAADLLAELAVLGVTVWWDEVNQKVRFKINRPIDAETIYDLTDERQIISGRQVDREDSRITDVLFNTVQIDPSKGKSNTNFRRSKATIDVDVKLPQAYGDTKIKEINCRWLNHGDEASVRIISTRLLNRFTRQPAEYEIVTDYSNDINVADVAMVSSSIVVDPTGELQSHLAQVIMREDLETGHTVRLTLQKYQFDNQYGFITENTRPSHSDSTMLQKMRGAYFVDDTLLFSDGSGPYRFI